MIAGESGRVDGYAFLPSDLFFGEVERDGVIVYEAKPAAGGDHEVSVLNDLGVDHEFGVEIARMIIDSRIFAAAGGYGFFSAHIPGLNDEYRVGRSDRGFIMEDDRVRDAFRDGFVDGEGEVGYRQGVIAGFTIEDRVAQEGDREDEERPPVGEGASCGKPSAADGGVGRR